ncbi:GLPGLI family protein [Polaribacter sp. SA4-10]|uniref:GLPGLI family protein n=1 Tax=Polaribacter sp. SA4-10 TaxID=754397 RepID=UPI000B3C8C90|nr:GLPGLI family protein [Polaribacter sp. SA4-10]ARV07443.1 GLPGLI family protein [Polaribacter sp. SA4-10]
MKIKLLTTLILFCSLIINGQNFTGKAIYKTSIKSSFSFGDDKNSTMSDDMKKRLHARMQKMNQKTFILYFDQKASTYKEEIQLDAPKPQVGGAGVVLMSFGGSGNGSVYFKNIKEQRFSNQTEIMGKRFLVKDKLPEFEWELSSETKNIGNYTCYKATFTKEVENIIMTIDKGESKKEEKKEIITTTAWYTLQVSVSNGPDNYQGLPGLILEINDGKKTIVCTEIVLNPSDKIKIAEPEKGKVVSQKEFNKIQKQKSKEMMETFKSRKGVDLGNSLNIKIGG